MLSRRHVAASRGSRSSRSRLIAFSITAALLSSSCATTHPSRPRSIPAEIVSWSEKRTFGIDRIYVVQVAYRSPSGALCTTSVEIDQLTWAQLRRGAPCIVPYLGRYTVAACP
jgi:hypothetical protein